MSLKPSREQASSRGQRTTWAALGARSCLPRLRCVLTEQGNRRHCPSRFKAVQSLESRLSGQNPHSHEQATGVMRRADKVQRRHVLTS